MLWLLVFGVLSVAVGDAQGTCPHQEYGLKPWSHAGTWPHGRKPRAHSAVTISQPVLLDEQPPELDSIRISPTGWLVWSPSINITLKLKYIYIEGEMNMGSESCLFTGPAHIILTGHQRGELTFKDHMGMWVGDKVILVAPGGTLEIHGQRKLPWTKLTRTLPRLTSKNGILFEHQKTNNSKHEDWEHGIKAYVLDIDRHNHVNVKSFGSYELISIWQAQRERDRFIHLMQNLTTGDILLLSVHHGVDSSKDDLTPVFDVFETLAFGRVTGRSLLRTIKDNDTYTAVIQKGNERASFSEDHQPFHIIGDVLTATSSFLPPSTTVKVSAESFIHTKHPWTNMVNFKVTTQRAAFPKLRVVDDTSTWRPGDRVVLTSTDYDWKQAEEATVVDCHDCMPHEVKIDLEPKFDHWGVIENRVDERGEVALLTRNIVIEGEVGTKCLPEFGNCHDFIKDTFGGHMKFLRDSTVHIEGAELYHMGQQTDIGRYPLHFHMGFDMRNVTHPPYLRENSVHHAFSRCITVHGTHGVLVRDNVCYNTLGHAYFIEDGGEWDTVFDGNLAASVKKGKLLKSDSEQPTAFWITSPRTTLRNNVAAGGEGNGIWYIFPIEPVGPSRGLGFFQPHEADHTAITEFDNNVVHSNQESGIFFDKRLKPDGSAADGQFYFPKENPLDDKSADKEVKIYRLTAFKNVNQNSWFRGGYINVTQSSLADSAKAVTFARSSNQEQFMTDSVIIGMSSNLGYPAENWTRSLPVWYDRHNPIQGFTFYDGPVYGRNIWFDGFVSTREYMAGAIGYERGNEFASSPVSGVLNAKFGFVDGETTGNRIYDGDEGIHGFSRKDGDCVATSRDTDASITGIRNAQVVKPWPFFVTPDCEYHSNWNMAVCPHIYGKIVVHPEKVDSGKTFPIMVRDDLPTISETVTGVNSNQFMVILGGSKSYTMHWSSYVPSNINIYTEGIAKGQHVRVGVCLPRDATFDLYTYAPHYLPHLSVWTEATSLHDLDGSDGSKYYHDKTSGLLYFKFLNEFDRLGNETKSCANNRCPMVQIKNVHGSHQDHDCRSRVYHTTRISDNRAMTLPADTKHMGATMAHPPSNWGAGATKPFINRIPVNGGFGHWSGWGHCTTTCGGGHQERTRACDSPVPAHGGKSCHGHYRQTRSCKTQHCPIDGGFTAWSAWTTCTKTTGCQGYKKRSRTCSQPAPNYAGVYCHGSDGEIDACQVC